MVMQSVKP